MLEHSRTNFGTQKRRVTKIRPNVAPGVDPPHSPQTMNSAPRHHRAATTRGSFVPLSLQQVVKEGAGSRGRGTGDGGWGRRAGRTTERLRGISRPPTYPVVAAAYLPRLQRMHLPLPPPHRLTHRTALCVGTSRPRVGVAARRRQRGNNNFFKQQQATKSTNAWAQFQVVFVRGRVKRERASAREEGEQRTGRARSRNRNQGSNNATYIERTLVGQSVSQPPTAAAKRATERQWGSGEATELAAAFVRWARCSRALLQPGVGRCGRWCERAHSSQHTEEFHTAVPSPPLRDAVRYMCIRGTLLVFRHQLW